MSLLVEALRQLDVRPDEVVPLEVKPAARPSLPAAPQASPAQPAVRTAELVATQPASVPEDAIATAPVVAASVNDVAPPEERQFIAVWDRLFEKLHGRLPSSLALVALPGTFDEGWWPPLAVAFTRRQSGRVLLVEGRQPATIDPALDGISTDAEHHPGIAELAQRRVTWRTTVTNTAMPRIDLLSRGAIRNPTAAGNFDPFDLAQLRQLWSDLNSDYPLVLVAAGRADNQTSLALAASCEATLLLLNLIRTPQTMALDARRRLQSAGARPVGCLLCA